MGECVMSLYGIVRLLRSRELGPSQLRPTLDAFGASAQDHCVRMGPLFTELNEAAKNEPRLHRAVRELQGSAARVTSDVLTTFEACTKLGARERLDLEREAERLGAELEAVRRLASAVYAALKPRAVDMSLGDLLEARWQVAPTFVADSLTLRLASAPQARFEGEPRVLRLLVEHALRRLCADDVDQPSASALRVDASVHIILGSEPEGFQPGDLVPLPLGATLDSEPVIVSELALHLGIEIHRHEQQVQLWIPR